MKKSGLIFSFVACIASIQLFAQNVGIGTSNPTARLHVSGDATVARFQSNSSTVSQIVFESTGGTAGYIGLNAGFFRVASAGGDDLRLGTASGHPLVITTNNNVGIGTTTPVEKLEIASGNIQLNLSTKGILLNAADRPLITRSFDAFTSGNYNGVGRWGLFMEPSKLSFGIPNLVGKAFSFSAYEANSTANEILQIDRVGQVKRPETGNHDLMPVCIGTVGTFGAKVAGTDNFSSIRDCTVTCDGTYAITITDVYFETTKFIAVVTPLSSVSKRYSCHYWAEGGKLMVQTYLEDNENISAFSFVVYRMVY